MISDGSIGTKGRYVYYPEGTDYYDLMYKKSVFAQNQNLSISGSDGKFDYYLSGRFYSYDGLFDSDEQTDKFKTYNMRFKGGYQLTPWLKINNNFEFPIINTTIRLPIRKVLVWYGEISRTRDTRHRHCSTLMVR